MLKVKGVKIYKNLPKNRGDFEFIEIGGYYMKTKDLVKLCIKSQDVIKNTLKDCNDGESCDNYLQDIKIQIGNLQSQGFLDILGTDKSCRREVKYAGRKIYVQ